MKTKDFSGVTKQKINSSVSEIEQNMWKYNVKTGPRIKKDFLDASTEDFSKNKSKGIDGSEITPSTFNITRDSLRV